VWEAIPTLSLPPQTAKGLCLGQEDLLILDPLALVTHFFTVFYKLSKASCLAAEIYFTVFLFRRGGKKWLGKYTLCLAFSRVLRVLVLPSRWGLAQLLQEPCVVCSATYLNSSDDNEMRIVEEGKQDMRQERWSHSEHSTGPTSCWVNSLLTSWEGGQKSRASLVKIFGAFHSPCTN